MKKVFITICFIIYFITMGYVQVYALAYAMDESVLDALNTASAYACNSMGIDSFNMVIDVTDSSETGNKVYCVFNQAEYDKLKASDKKEYMKLTTKYITTGEEALNSAQLQQAYNFLVGVDDRYVNQAVSDLLNGGNANLMTAISVISPAMPYINTAFGILVVAILLFTVAVTIMDIAYMSLPVFSSGGKDDKKPKLISNEAYKSMTESVAKNENVYGLYFKKRFFALILIAVCVTILISGKLGDLISTIIGLFV